MRNPLPKILEFITGHPRQKEKIVWSSELWISNVFRLWELIFWRRFGIKAEMTSGLSFDDDGKPIVEYFFHSWEAVIVNIEVVIRFYFKNLRFPKIVKVYVPQLAFAGLGAPVRMGSPYRFAIAYDATDAGLFDNSGTATVFTLAHTCTGTNLMLAVGFYKDHTTPATVSSFTYNSSNLTLAKEEVSTNLFDEYLYYILGPSTGTHNEVLTLSNAIPGNSKQLGMMGTSYTGVKQSGQPDSTAGNTQASEASLTVTTTVVAANCWLVGHANNDEGVMTGLSTGTSRGSAGNSWFGDSNGTVGTGSQSLVWSKSASTQYDTGVMMSIAPAVTPQLPSVTDSTAVSDTPTIFIPILTLSVSDSTAIGESIGIGNPIAFDNAASFSSAISSISGSYTTAGINRGMVAFVYSVTVPFAINPPTYNGVAMENVAVIQLPSGYSGFLAAYYLPKPAIGANTFAVTASGVAGLLYASVMSYDNVSPDSDIDNFAFSVALLVSSITETLTSDLNGEWAFLGVVSGLAATITAGAGATSRTNSSPLWTLDTNGSVGPPNTTYSMTANSSSSVDGLAAIMFSLEPYIWFQTQPSILLSEDIFVLDQPTITVSNPLPSVSDTTAVSDTPTIAQADTISKTDTTAVSDTPTIEIISFISVTDSTAVSDTPTIEIIDQGINVSDTTAVSDTPTILIPILVPSVSDTTVMADVPFIYELDQPIVTDFSAVSEVITMELFSYPSVSDSTAISDTPNIEIISYVSITDSTAVSDTPTIEIVDFISVTDSTAVSDSTTVEIATQLITSDTTAVSDTPTLEMFSYISVQDTTAVSDTPTMGGTLYVVASDTTAVTDTPNFEEEISYINVQDTTVVSDTPNVMTFIVISVQDSTAITEEVSVRRPPNIKYVVLQLGFQKAAYPLLADA